MKTLGFIIALLTASLTSVFAQGQIQIINGGTNLVAIATNDATDVAIIANTYIGAFNTVQNNGGVTNVLVSNQPSGTSYITNVNSSGGLSIVQRPTFAPSGYRVCANVFNANTNGVAVSIKFGYFPVGTVPDAVINPGAQAKFYFEDGYDGVISARSQTNTGVANIVYSEFGN